MSPASCLPAVTRSRPLPAFVTTGRTREATGTELWMCAGGCGWGMEVGGLITAAFPKGRNGPTQASACCCPQEWSPQRPGSPCPPAVAAAWPWAHRSLAVEDVDQLKSFFSTHPPRRTLVLICVTLNSGITGSGPIALHHRSSIHEHCSVQGLVEKDQSSGRVQPPAILLSKRWFYSTQCTPAESICTSLARLPWPC